MSRLGEEAMVEKIGNRRNSSSSPEWSSSSSSEWFRAAPGDLAWKPEDPAEPARLRGMATGDGVEMDDAGEEPSPMVVFEAGSEGGSG